MRLRAAGEAGEVARGDAVLARIALWVIAAALLSGPIGAGIALVGSGGGAWVDAATYAARYRRLEQVPFWFGFLFIGAWLAFFARLAAHAEPADRMRALAALAVAAAYAAMIATNYTLQIGYVPQLAARADPAVAYLTMANPESVAWVLEMFGYAMLGAACWVAAPLFRDAPRGATIVALLRTNGIVNIAGAVAMEFGADWLLAPIGVAAYLLWNGLVVGTMAVIAVAFRPRPVAT
jgi:hypothetical protein